MFKDTIIYSEADAKLYQRYFQLALEDNNEIEPPIPTNKYDYIEVYK